MWSSCSAFAHKRGSAFDKNKIPALITNILYHAKLGNIATVIHYCCFEAAEKEF
jgi:hypothetical protein